MAQPFIGEIKMFAGNFAPRGYAFCAGQAQAIDQNTALYTLIGTTYGGDGVNTFNLPDLRGRIPVHQGGGFVIGQLAGVESVTLVSNQLPVHGHVLSSNSNTGTATAPTGNVVAGSTLTPYVQTAPDTVMGIQMIGNSGSSQPHDNLMPYQCINFVIALEGVFPSQN
ncbi:MAG: tail fiber protein [Actinomycetota bacterium]